MDLVFNPVDARFDLLNIHAAVEFDVRGQQNMIRPQLHGAQVSHLLDRWVCPKRPADRAPTKFLALPSGLHRNSGGTLNVSSQYRARQPDILGI